MSTSTTARDRIARLHGRLRRAGHDLAVRLWDGTELGPAETPYRLVLPTPGALRTMLVPPTDLHVGEAFVTEVFDVEGSMVEAIHAVADLRASLPRRDLARVAWDLLRLPGEDGGPLRALVPRALAPRAALSGRRHSRGRDRAAILHHYDVGEDFYRLFLDEQLVYSCAYFLEHDEDLARPPDPHGEALERAQARKLDVVCRKLGLRPGMRMLDIGCGWGALVLHAACEYGVHAVGVTLSDSQAEIAEKRIAEAGVGDRVEIHLRHYRDVPGTFDAVASVGMVEHVGANHLPAYAASVFERVAPGGRFLNHGISTGRRRQARDLGRDRHRGFVGEHVFPDGALVPADHMVGVLQDAGFEILDLEQLRPHYARTLRHWTARLEARHADAVELVGEATTRTWRAYMAGSAVGFDHGDLGLLQILCGRGADLAFGRRTLLPADDHAS